MPVLNPTLDRVLFKANGGGYTDIFPIDAVASILVASNILDCVLSDSAPGDISKLWFDPDNVTPASGVYKIWDVPTAAWVPLTALRFMQWIVRRGGQTIPTGAVQAYTGAAAPSGWLLCNGLAVPRATYADLFAVIGTTYGAGDNATTFNLPDLRGEFLRGADTMGTARGVDSARVLGSNQDWSTAAPKNKNPTRITADGSPGPALINATNPSTIGFVRLSKSGEVVTVTSWDAAASGVEIDTINPMRGDDETRPRNVAVTYIIKA